MGLNVGDWVRSYSAGIWQIYRVLEDYKCLDPLTGNETINSTIFSKRFVSNSFRKSFKEECCHPSFVTDLKYEEMKKLEIFIVKNSVLYAKFVKYEPKPIASVYNARIGIPTNRSVEEIARLIPSSESFTALQISPFLQKLGFDTKQLPSWTVQFVSENHQCENGWLVYKFSRVFSH
jgi:hypothetical protein